MVNSINDARFEVHAHTVYSNIRLIDCINSVEGLIERAIDNGLAGIAITDHEALCAHVKANQFAQKIAETNPTFKVALGNEIYLCPNREKGQKYFHFILIAKNAQGYRALKELSSRAWFNSFEDRRLERVITTYDDLKEICQRYPNSLIGTTACLGGELSTLTKKLIEAEKLEDTQSKQEARDGIIDFLLMCKDIFGEDFYIECAPGCSRDQIMVNRRLISISQCFEVPMVVGTDAHYLKKEDRFIHKAFLNSKDGEREVDTFYEFSYLQTNEEIIENLSQSSYDEMFTEKMFRNSMDIYNKIENYSLFHTQQIPTVEIKDYPRTHFVWEEEFPILGELFNSKDKMERYWVNQCFEGMKNKGINWDSNIADIVYVKRLEEEARTKKIIGEKLDTNMFSYPVTLQHYINLIWECGSPIGAGRGSSCAGLNHYLLGVTQLDPIKWDLPWFRYMNEERAEIADIDIDIAPGKRPLILRKIREERRNYIDKNLDVITRNNLGCTLVAAFKTESPKSTVQTACRGYRSEEYPDGIDIDISMYLSSLIPVERGEQWTIEDVLYGNEEKGRKPIQPFINEIYQYDGLIDIIMGIKDLVSARSSHASGVIFFENDPYEHCAFMKTPSGDIITQWDLHEVEYMGLTKYDFLVTEIQDKIVQCINLLQEDGEIEPDLTIRQVYDKYLAPEKLNIENTKVWDAIDRNEILNLFQFDSEVGSQAAKKIRPRTMRQLADSNGLMRLAPSEKGAEPPMEKYIRFKENISLWYDEMRRYGLTAKEVEAVKPYFEPSFGVPPSQEQLMLMLMDKDICNFTLAEANTARKIVAKKQVKRIPELKMKVQTSAGSPNLGRYIWECGVKPQATYSFSIIHALAYSFIGYQTAFLATHWNPIYWNTACLIINSSSEDEDEEYDDEDEEETIIGAKKKKKTANYEKIARALGTIISRGIKVSIVDINKSDLSFKPDAKNNQILYGLRPLTQVNEEQIEQIIAGRPYKDFYDFLNRCPLKKPTMISLIKGGAFDNLEIEWANELGIDPRILIMAIYISRVSEPKSKLNLQNFSGLIQKGLIPDSMVEYKYIFNFNKYIKANFKAGSYLVLKDEDCYDFYEKRFDCDILEVVAGVPCIKEKIWSKIYTKAMDGAREWLKDNQEEILQMFNERLFFEMWDKYADGTVSAWEMSALCFYYHDHELKDIDFDKYGIKNFFDMPTTPPVDYYYKKKGRQLPVYKITRIAGTVIGKNDARASIALLTVDGVVNVKFTKEYYAMFKKQISEKDETGVKHVKEKSWFKRGTKLMIQGYRKDDTFVSKTYYNTPGHQLYKIIDVNGKNITLTSERYQVEDEDV